MEKENILDKKSYLKIREQLRKGYVNEEILQFFYNHWINNKKEEYKDLTYDEFKPLFMEYLQYGVNFTITVNNIFEMYDRDLHVTCVKDRTGKLLTII